MKSRLSYILLLVLFMVFTNNMHSQDLHPFVKKAKETSLYSQQVNWEEVNQKFITLTNGKESTDELKEGLQYLINSLGDKHASIRSTKNYSILVGYNGPVQENDNRDPDFVNTVINDINAKFSYAYLEGNIGYLKVVGIGPCDVKEQSDFIRKGLLELKTKGADKWIVDLRFNGGGNIEPMIAGLAPLIGNGFVGGAVNNQGAMRKYIITDGQATNHNRLICQMDNNPVISSNEKLAVLLSRYTISSGEMLAISFKGRANTRFIGEQTAGYTTGNGYDLISDDLALVISQDVFLDRNKKRYDHPVDVDEYIPFQHQSSLEGDLQVKSAIQWLKK